MTNSVFAINKEIKMKKILLVVALAAVLVFAFSATAFAYSPKPAYIGWSAAGVNSAGPHADFQATTTKCEVCHAVHNGYTTGTTTGDSAKASNPVNNGFPAAPSYTVDASGTQLLLRSTVANSCTYCHIQTAVGGVQLYGGPAGGVFGTWGGPGHAGGWGTHTGSACVNCHSVHGANTFLGANKAKILKFPPSESGPGDFQTGIIGGGTGINGLYATNSAAKNSNIKYVQQTVFCTGCHENYSESADYNTGSTDIVGGAKTHSMVANPSSNFSATNGGTVNTYSDGDVAAVSAPTQNTGASTIVGAVASAADNSCRSCHPGGATDQTGITLNSFPHYAKGQPYYLIGTGATPPSTDLVGQSNANDYVGVDANCLRCHAGDGTTYGVGVNF